MTIAELIVELQKLDPQMQVCGESETCTWDIKPEDLVPDHDVSIPYFEPTDRARLYVKYRTYENALILGYKNR